MLVVHGQSRVAPEHMERYIASARATAEASRRAPGNVSYRYCADLFDPTLIHTCEIWQSGEAFRAHVCAPHHAHRVMDITEMNALPHDVKLYPCDAPMTYEAWKAAPASR